MKKHNPKKTYLIIALFVLAVIALGSWIYIRMNIIAVFDYPTDITIADATQGGGLGIRKGEVHFGMIHPGFESKSGLVAYNYLNETIRVSAYPHTSFTHWMTFTTPSDFLLAPHQKQEINITVNPPGDAKPGKYSGNIVVLFKKV